LICWRALTRMLGFISTLFLARLLVPADFGLVAIATTLLAAIEQLSELGLRDALVRHQQITPSLQDTAFTIQAIRGLASGIIVGSTAWVSGTWFGDERLVALTLIFAVVGALSGFENIAIVRFQREMRFDMQFQLMLWPRLIQFVLTVGAALLWRNYWSLVLGVVVGRISRLIVTYAVQPYCPRITLASWRELIGFSFWSWASSILGMALARSEAFVLGPALGPAMLGTYFVAAEIGGLASTELIGPAASALFAGVALARNRGADAIGLSGPLISMLIIATAPLGLAISATSGYLVAGLLGQKWIAGQSVIAILSLTTAVSPINYVAVMVMSASGHIYRTVYAKIGAVLIKVCALLLAVRFTDLQWVALGLTLAVIGEAGMFLWQLSRCGLLTWRLPIQGILRSCSACTIVAAALWTAGLGWKTILLPPFTALLIGGALGLGITISCLALTFLIWAAAGRPEGPESGLLDIARDFLPKREARLDGTL
jgi:lipopolysaccharide exporter